MWCSKRLVRVPWTERRFSSVQLRSRVWLFVIPWTVVFQASLSTISQSLLNLISIELVMPSTILSSVVPFSSCLQCFPASGLFPVSWLFSSGGQTIGASASASVLPKNIQGRCPLRLTGLIIFLSKGLFKSLLQHRSSKASILWCSAFFYDLTLASIHVYWINPSFD